MRLSRLPLFIAASICAVVGFGVAQAQIQLGRPRTQADTDTDWQMRFDASRALYGHEHRTGNNEEAEKVAFENFKKTLSDAVGSSERTASVAGQVVKSDNSVNPEATALALMQNQRIIEQNARIIQLLETIAKKK